MSDAMTEEEYLRARGWSVTASGLAGKLVDGKVRGQRLIAAAVDTQVEEDRRLYNFVRARSEMRCGMLFPNKPEDAVATDAWLLSQAKGTGRT